MKFSHVCVYCGASSNIPDVYMQAGKDTGKMLAERGIVTVYGGARDGLMGTVANAALEAGGDVIGVIPTHILENEIRHEGLTELHEVIDMHTRKQLLEQKSQAFVVLPGGFGTLDEYFEILTWKRLGLHDKEIFLVNVNGFWDPIIEMMQTIKRDNFASPSAIELVKVVDSVEGLEGFL